ncbi:MAG: 23S rRNA (pseudouridine(1915)-N(3))-methyltransferase RlmH [bacterium]|nr:23S rRNA (pseudouridine(1915)-N(3))-methyltransferase RlmH [bacterium]MDY5827951.1 23S rRNA (pseudouridine(1915)-N(3))-methyltransferase RlmH [Candidatus Limisoma sp.]
MKIELFVVGKTNHNYLSPGIEDYLKRINRYIQFSIRCISDAKNTKNLSQQQQKNAEGQNILVAIDNSDYVVLLDEHGKEYKSIEFASLIDKKMQTVAKRLVFVVGGPYGFSEDVYKRANEKISLSKMTFPHDLIRLIFVEQLYRAFSILNHEPYHHE